MKRSRDLQEEVNSSFVNEQEAAIVPVAKVIGLDADRSNDGDSTATALQCSLPGHLPGLSFATYHEYESHYNNAHTNRCLECGKNFPSSHYLDLHIAECHDVLVEIRKDKGEAVVRDDPAWYVCTSAGVDNAYSTIVSSKPVPKIFIILRSGSTISSEAICSQATISSPSPSLESTSAEACCATQKKKSSTASLVLLRQYP